MERLTTNKSVTEMGMYELAHNSCYIAENGSARYRDFNTDIDARAFVRNLMTKYGHWKSYEEYGLDADNELIDDDIFDDTMLENLMYDTGESIGLIALFYRNLWAMAELREQLKAYEDAEEQGLLLKLPCKIGGTVFRINIGAKEPIILMKVYKISFMNLDDWGKNIMIYAMSKDGNENCYYRQDIGKIIFLTKEEAEQRLAELRGE